MFLRPESTISSWNIIKKLISACQLKRELIKMAFQLPKVNFVPNFNMNVQSTGHLLINHCDYTFFCRELMSVDGRPAMLGLEKSPPSVKVTFLVQPGREFSIGSVNLIKEDQWTEDFLKQVFNYLFTVKKYELIMPKNGFMLKVITYN